MIQVSNKKAAHIAPYAEQMSMSPGLVADAIGSGTGGRGKNDGDHAGTEATEASGATGTAGTGDVDDALRADDSGKIICRRVLGRYAVQCTRGRSISQQESKV